MIFKDWDEYDNSIRRAFDFNGVNQFMKIPTAHLVSGDWIEFTFIAHDISEIANRFWADSSDASVRVSVHSDGLWNEFGPALMESSIDGNPLVRFVTDLTPYADGSPHTIRMNMLGPGSVDYINSTRNKGQLSSTITYDVRINAQSGSRFYPMDGGSNIVRDVISEMDGEIVNHTDNWIEMER